MADHTSENVDARFDPRTHRMEGIAREGNAQFSVPFVSIADDAHEGVGLHELWVGGCMDGLKLPLEIQYVVTVYPWESYVFHDGVKGHVSERLYDRKLEEDPELVRQIVGLAWVTNGFRMLGPTLVHCQAGLNRSNLIAGTSLILLGRDNDEVIQQLRDRRSPAVLCNASFEQFLRYFSVSAAA